MKKSFFSVLLIGGLLVPAISFAGDAAQSAIAHFDLGMSYFLEKKYDTALEEAKMAARLDPSSTQAANLVGSIYLEMKDYPKAELALKQSLQLDAQNNNALSNLGALYCQTNRFQEGLDMFGKSLASPKQDKMSMILVNAGICLIKKGDEKAAEQYFLKAIQLEPDFVWGYWQLARLAFKQGRLDEAKSRIETIHRYAPPNNSTLWMMTLIARQKNDKQEYERVASRLVEQFPQSEETQKLYRRDFTVNEK